MIYQVDTLFVKTKISDDERNQTLLTCPVCGHDYSAFSEVTNWPSDDYSAWPGGRGSLDAIKLDFECEHTAYLCFGFHKGQTFVYVIADEKTTQNDDSSPAEP